MIICQVINDLDKTRICTVEQMSAVLDATRTLELTPPANAQARCTWIASVLAPLSYRPRQAQPIAGWCYCICVAFAASAAPMSRGW
ncbi:hypothetical protein EMIT0111MI5_130206 [Burkholderia sp. IT-111MI5]